MIQYTEIYEVLTGLLQVIDRLRNQSSKYEFDN